MLPCIKNDCKQTLHSLRLLFDVSLQDRPAWGPEVFFVKNQALTARCGLCQAKTGLQCRSHLPRLDVYRAWPARARAVRTETAQQGMKPGGI